MIERPLDQWLLRQLAALQRDVTIPPARRTRMEKEYGRRVIEAAALRHAVEQVREAEARAEETGKAVWEEVEQIMRDRKSGRIL